MASTPAAGAGAAATGTGADFAKLLQLHAFGAKGGIRESALFSDENTVLHPVGGHVVSYNMESGQAQFLQKLKNAKEILAMAISPNLRAVALCERTRDEVRPSAAAAAAAAAAASGAGAGAGAAPGGDDGKHSSADDDGKAQVSVYHVASRRKMRTMTLNMKGEFHLCAFSGDNKFLATAGGHDMMLVVWKWNAEKVVAMSRVHPGITRIHFVPRDSTLLSVSGPQYLRFWRCTSDSLRELPAALPKQDAVNWADHAWMGARPAQTGEPVVERRMLAITDKGQLFVLGKQEDTAEDLAPASGAGSASKAAAQAAALQHSSGFELQHTIDVDLMESKEDSSPTTVKCITAYGKGFAIGGSNGFFCVFEKTDNKKEPFIHIKSFKHGNDVITSMAVAPTDETLVAYSALSMHRAFPLSRIDDLPANMDHFQYMVDRGVHTRGVIAMDVCRQQPTAVTCSSDGTVRLWNYLNWTCEVAATLTEDPLTVALHPSGLFVAVGSKDRLVIYNIEIHSLSPMLILPAKQIRAVRFSNGGHFLAASVGLLVQVFDTFTGELVRSFHGHIGAIRQLVWSHDDHILCSAGEDGHVYAFSLYGPPPPRIENLSHVVKTCRFTSCAITKDKQSVVAAGRDASGLCILQVASRGEITTYNTNGCRIMKVALSADNKLLYCGTAVGNIRVYEWPLTSPGSGEAPDMDVAGADDVPKTSVSYALPEPVFMEFPLHQARVTGLCVTPDSLYLLSCSDDASVFAMGIPYAAPVRGGARAQAVAAAAAAQGHASGALTWEAPPPKNYNVEVALVDRDDMEESLRRLAAMEKKLEEVKNASEYALHMKESQFQDKAAALGEDMEKAVAVERARYDSLQSRHETYVREQVEKREQAKAEYARLSQDMENQYETKLALEMERYDKLSEQMERVVQTTRSVLQEAQEKQASQVHSLTSEIQEKNAALQALKEQTDRDMATAKARHDEAVRQIEQEYEEEITKMRQSFQKDLSEEETKTAQKQGALTSQGNKLESMKKRLLESKQKCTAKEKECDKLNHRILQMQEQMRTMARALEVRDASLLDKEKEIAGLRTENRTLDNFRFVLDHKISKMSSERGPINEHVTHLEAHIERMFGEMVSEFETKKTAARVLAGKELKLDSLQQELASLRASVRNKDREITAFQAAAETLLHTDARHMAQAVKDLYHQFVTKSKRRPGGPPGRPRASVTKSLADMPNPKVSVAASGGGDGVLKAAKAAAATVAATPEDPAAAAAAKAAEFSKAPRRVGSSGEVPLKEHQETVAEMVRQKEFLVHSTQTLKTQLAQANKQFARKSEMAAEDNIMLMHEVNDLRKQLVERDRRVKALERELYQSTGKTLGATASTSVRGDTMGAHKPPPTSPIAASGSRSDGDGDGADGGRGGSGGGGSGRSGNQSGGGTRRSKGLSRTMPIAGSQSAASLAKPYSRLRASASTDSVGRPASVAAGRAAIARGSTKAHREVLNARHQIDALHVQLEVQERELNMQRGEIQRLRDALASSVLQPLPSVSSGGGGTAAVAART